MGKEFGKMRWQIHTSGSRGFYLYLFSIFFCGCKQPKSASKRVQWKFIYTLSSVSGLSKSVHILNSAAKLRISEHNTKWKWKHFHFCCRTKVTWAKPTLRISEHNTKWKWKHFHFCCRTKVTVGSAVGNTHSFWAKRNGVSTWSIRRFKKGG